MIEEVKFHVFVGEDQIIRPPAGVSLPGGKVEVTVRATADRPVSEEEDIESLRALLLGIAAEAERIAPPMPSDMAMNHDHYGVRPVKAIPDVACKPSASRLEIRLSRMLRTELQSIPCCRCSPSD